jgi:uncharacterized repeat protein (TIGR02543 family)
MPFFNRPIGCTIRPVLAKTLDYTISFNANGAEGEMTDVDAKYAQTITLPTCTFTKEEEVFKGWNTEPNGTGTSYKENQVLTITEDLTLYAIWRSKQGYVDLGLPSGLLWASCNIGAENPEEFGDYFAWGEVEPLDENYKWGSDNKYGDRCSRVSFELVDDAARQIWGGGWRVPLPEEIEELIAECEWTWTVLNNVNGYEVKGPNGNSIFLPAAGSAYWSSQGIRTYSQGSCGYYRGNLKHCQTYTTMFDKKGISAFIEMHQEEGYSIRPVRNKTAETYTLTFNANGGEGEMESLSFEYAEYKTLPFSTFTKEGFAFMHWNTKADGTGTAYKDKSQITLKDNTTLYAQWIEYVSSEGNEYVDLGLSVKWATCNLGAEKPEEFGDYYAWGEVKTKNSYTTENYNFTAYPSVLLLENDAASVNWGGDWRMPTKAEFKELIDNCTMTTLSYGIKFTATNGNYIILPFGGFKEGLSDLKSPQYGYYWTSDLSTSDNSKAYDIIIGTSKLYYEGNRHCGLLIRPVLPK